MYPHRRPSPKLNPEEEVILKEIETVLGRSLISLNVGNMYMSQMRQNQNGFMAEKGSIVALICFELDLIEFPEVITSLKCLRTLDLHGNNLISIPESIGKLKTLRKLDLENNQLDTLPKSFKNLSSLSTLNLLANNFKVFPEILSELKNLSVLKIEKKLLLDEDQLEVIKSIEDLIGGALLIKNKIGRTINDQGYQESHGNGVKIEGSNVVGLCLNECGIKNLPESIGNLKFLKELWLGVNTLMAYTTNQIEKLPESVGEMVSLEKLDLQSNNLKELPRDFVNLKNLKELNLWNNKFTVFPNEITSLSSLERLDFSNNKITNIPSSIGNLTSLKKLFINGQNFKIGIERLPDEIGDLKSLEILQLKNCEITDLQGSIGNLTQLKELDLSASQIKQLPETFGALKRLKKLFVQGNNLEGLSESFGNLKSLQILDLRDNQLSSLPESFGELESLQELLLHKNQLRSLPYSFGKLTNLNFLDLSDNQFESLPGSIWSLKALERLDLEGDSWTGESKNLLETYNERDPYGISNRFIKKRDLPKILEFCQKQAAINIFISHAVNDFEEYRVEEIANFLENEVEIFKVYYCEQDLQGNIDVFMNENIPKCQLLLFIATKKSVYDSQDCAYELDLARNVGVQILPIKGRDVSWDDLNTIDLGRELGTEFESEKFNNFFIKLFNFIKDYKTNVNLFDKEALQVKKAIYKTVSHGKKKPNQLNKVIGMIRLRKSVNIERASQLLEIPKEEFEEIIFGLVGEEKVVGQLEGDNFIITSDIECFIDNLRRNII